MNINSPPPHRPNDKEPKAFLMAMNRQMKTEKSLFRNSNCLPVPITVSAGDIVDDLFHNPGEESEFMQGSTRGDAELMNLRFRLVMKTIDCMLVSWPLSPSPRPLFLGGLPLVIVGLP